MPHISFNDISHIATITAVISVISVSLGSIINFAKRGTSEKMVLTWKEIDG